MVGQDFFYIFFELTIVNARVIFQECNGNVARLKRYPFTFRNDLITGLTAGYSRQVRRIGRPIPPTAEDRLSKHDHKLVPIPGWNCKFEPNSEDCKVCSDKGQVAGRCHRTTTKCNKCQVAMYVYPCFDRYHTLLQGLWKWRVSRAGNYPCCRTTTERCR